jgi:hypothetical protein
MAIHNIGSGTKSTSYPDPSLAGRIPSFETSLGQTGHNGNAANFDDSTPVKNESPAVAKTYSWNKSEIGNAH